MAIKRLKDRFKVLAKKIGKTKYKKKTGSAVSGARRKHGSQPR